MKFLEEALPPPALLWLEDNIAATDANAMSAIAALDMHVSTLSTKSVHYAADVVMLACMMRLRAECNNAVPIAIPAATEFAPGVGTTLLPGLAATIVRAGGALERAVNLYLYAQIKPMLLRMQVSALCSDSPTQRLRTVMSRFSTDCKFKRTGDLFIWSILYLKLPAWLASNRGENFRPYHIAPAVFGAATNEQVQPWIKRSVSELTACARTKPHELFCIIGAMAIELSNAGDLLVNTEVAKANSAVPTLAALSPDLAAGAAHTFGYVCGNRLHSSSDPFAAVAAWAVATDPTSYFSQVCDDATPLEVGNPFAKYLD